MQTQNELLKIQKLIMHRQKKIRGLLFTILSGFGK